MADAQNTYDRQTWSKLLQNDPDIAAAATYLGNFGDQLVDDLAESYLAIGEKRYLSAIVAKLQRQAEQRGRAEDAGALRTTKTETGTNDQVKSTTNNQAPEFDEAKWNALANEDADVRAAIAVLGKYGSYYVADLAASFQAIGDKRYLQRIVDTIVTQAKSGIAISQERKVSSPTAGDPHAAPSTGTSKGRLSSGWDGRLETGVQHSASGTNSRVSRVSHSPDRQQPNVSRSATASAKLGVPALLALGVVGTILILFVGAALLTFQEYSTFRDAAGNADRLEAYARECRVCVFRSHANSEATRLRIVAAEARSFEASRGDIASLQAYVDACRVCTFSTVAREEMDRLKRQAVEAEAARRLESELALSRAEADRLRRQATEAEIARQSKPLPSAPMVVAPQTPPGALSGTDINASCSRQADALGLHGIPRKVFREQCKIQSASSAE